MTSSSDEGEITEGTSKATSTRAAAEGSAVDRQNRRPSDDYDNESRYSSSSRRSRSPRGYKRSRDDGRNYDGRSRYDEQRRDHYNRPRVSYEDLDKPSSRGSYDDRYRDRYSDKRPRNRTRSPRRDKGRLDRFVRGSDDRRDGRDGPRDRDSASSRTPVREAANAPKDDAKSDKGLNGDSRPSVSFTAGTKYVDRRHQEIGADRHREPEVDHDYEPPEPVDEEAEIERRRKRRAELMARSASATPLLRHAVGASEKRAPSTEPTTPSQMDLDSPATPRTPRSGRSITTPTGSQADGQDYASPRSPGSNPESPGGMELDVKNLMNTHGDAKDEDGPSAADYDPTVDMKEDERRDELRHGHVVLHGETHVVETTEKQSEQTNPAKADENDDDDDDDDDGDDFDMFADDFDEDKYASKAAPTAAPIETGEAKNDQGGVLEGDDKDGYYKIRVGEVISGRYQVQATLGRGMFSNVVRAQDITTKKLVAIKMMRNNDALRKGGYTEISILEKLNEADPEGKKHIIKFERSFDYRAHLCMVFENLSMNLREVVRKFGNNVGINLAATRRYAQQMFVALAHMRKCTIIHADLKPDNILVDDSRSILKICDLGTAIDRSDAATAQTGITPYLVSRFYRAPEIVLGMPYDYGVDMWSIGCTLFELYTGKILFAGDSNNQMLKAIMEIRGRLTPKLYKRGELWPQHFNEAGEFVSYERDKVLGKVCGLTALLVLHDAGFPSSFKIP